MKDKLRNEAIEDLKKNIGILKDLKTGCAVLGLACGGMGLAFAGVGILEGTIACNIGLAILIPSYVSAKVSQHRLEKLKEELESSTKEEFDVFKEYNLTDEDDLNKDR